MTTKGVGSCAICTEQVQLFGAAFTPCRHVFHRNCIIPWLERFQRTCPCCRRVVSSLDSVGFVHCVYKPLLDKFVPSESNDGNGRNGDDAFNPGRLATFLPDYNDEETSASGDRAVRSEAEVEELFDIIAETIEEIYQSSQLNDGTDLSDILESLSPAELSMNFGGDETSVSGDRSRRSKARLGRLRRFFRRRRANLSRSRSSAT